MLSSWNLRDSWLRIWKHEVVISNIHFSHPEIYNFFPLSRIYWWNKAGISFKSYINLPAVPLFIPSVTFLYLLNFSFLHTFLPYTLRVDFSFTLIFILVRFVIPSTKRNSQSSLNSTRNLCNQVPGKRFFTYVPPPLACTRTHAHSRASTHTHSHTTRVPVMCAAIRGK